MTARKQSYRIIQLNHGQVTMIDADMFEALDQWKWRAEWDSHTQSFYAARTDSDRRHVRMHRVILGLLPGDPRQGDHRNRDTLDNKRSNLRIATRSQNQANRTRNRNSPTAMKGVQWRKTKRRFCSEIKVKGKRIFLGYFDKAEDAHAAYCEAAHKYHGEFARTK